MGLGRIYFWDQAPPEQQRGMKMGGGKLKEDPLIWWGCQLQDFVTNHLTSSFETFYHTSIPPLIHDLVYQAAQLVISIINLHQHYHWILLGHQHFPFVFKDRSRVTNNSNSINDRNSMRDRSVDNRSDDQLMIGLRTW